MLRKDSSLDTTLLSLDTIHNNCFVEIDTRDGYGYHKIYGYRLGKNGSLSAIVADVNDVSGFRSVMIAKATGVKRSYDEEVGPAKR